MGTPRGERNCSSLFSGANIGCYSVVRIQTSSPEVAANSGPAVSESIHF